MAPITKIPTVFNLTGDHTTIHYQTTSTIGGPSLTYKAGSQAELRFSREEIRVLETEFGKLVIVTVGPGDAGDTTLTLLIPTIRVPSTDPDLTVKFETKAVLMALRKLGPVHQHYKVLNLQGTAQVIDF